MNQLFTRARAEQFIADQRHQANLAQLRAQADRADTRTLIGLVLVLLFILAL